MACSRENSQGDLLYLCHFDTGLFASIGNSVSTGPTFSTTQIDGKAALVHSKRAPGFLLLLTVLLLSLGKAPWCYAQASYEQIKSFGFPASAGAGSNVPMIEGSDGALYGTTGEGGISDRGTVFSLKKDGTGYRIVHDFVAEGFNPADPSSPVTEGTDGALYGTTYYGGAAGNGTIFKVNKDGSGFQIVREFGSVADGRSPGGPLALGTDGFLYGTTVEIADRYGGTVYRIRTNGTGYEILHWFTNGLPPGSVMLASDGLLYGAAWLSGLYSGGYLFRMNRDGGGYSILRAYDNGSTDGGNPTPGLIEGSDGLIYGTTFGGGTSNRGTVFKLAKDGTDYSVLHNFSSSTNDGTTPRWGVVQAPDGWLYGTTGVGGATGDGTVFRLSTNGTDFEVVHHFTSSVGDGAAAQSGVVCASDGALYGITRYISNYGHGTVFKVEPSTGDFGVLRRFSRTGGDGTAALTDLTEGSDGALYGVTEAGGTEDLGTVFKINKDGTGYILLHQFRASDGDGHVPEGGIIEASDGMLYGTALYGGYSHNGTVFRLNRGGSGYTTLHHFATNGVTGEGPGGKLLEGSDGILYGTTSWGGGENRGTIFRLRKDGSEFGILRDFSGTIGDPRSPNGSLVEGDDGLLYGTSFDGGADNRGTVFRISKNGSGFSVMHNFSAGGTDGRRPASIMEGSDGTLYGATGDGGLTGGGTVFKINKDGSGYSILRSFSSTNKGAFYVSGRLAEGSDGVLYGVTTVGGQIGSGTVFRLNKDGSGFAVLVSFFRSTHDGWYPYGGLIEGSDGALYGTTYNGGELNLGTIFRLRPAPQLSIRWTAGAPQIRFAGQRDRSYDILRSSSVDAAWETISTRMAPADHWIEYNDTNSVSGPGFYRVRRVP